MAGDMKDEATVMMEDKERQHKFQVEDDVRALTKAEEIKKDKTRYMEACKMMNEQMGMMGKAMGDAKGGY